MPKYRPAEPDDQEKAQEAFDILCSLPEKYPHIDPNQWTAGCISCFVNSFQQFTYEEFCLEMDCIKDFYKDWWEKP
jgi:hypothetical protein